MSGNFLAIVGTQPDLVRRARAIRGYRPALDRPGLLVMSEHRADLVELTGCDGVATGTIFDRAARAPLKRLDPHLSNVAVATEGASLIAQFWGAFVVFLRLEGRRVAVVRDPSGERPCYWSRRDGALIVTSTVRTCAEHGLIEPDIDWTTIAGHLLWPERRSRATCLRSVCELMPGERLTFGPAGVVIDTLWCPWRFGRTDMRIDRADEAADLVRRATLNTVSGWNKRYARPVVSLSGGLDSSILTTAAKGHAVAAVTLVTSDAVGDERRYARAVADHCSVPLVERTLHLSAVDPGRSHAANLPRPVARMFGQAANAIWYETATETGADALYHGGGGDNVFCYLTSCAPYLDSLLARGPGTETARTLRDIAALTEVSIWRVRRAAIRKAILDRGRFRWQRDERLLTAHAVTLGDALAPHPWFEAAPHWALPGKQAHIAALVRIQNYLDAIAPDASVAVIAPLMAQPVMETCLRIPTWMWCEGGRNRAVARAAFADLLPPVVTGRLGKGGPDVFEAQIMTTYNARIREMLLRGQLAEHGVIDRRAVASALDEVEPYRGTLYSRLSALVDVEAWLQSWTRMRGAGRAVQA